MVQLLSLQALGTYIWIPSPLINGSHGGISLGAIARMEGGRDKCVLGAKWQDSGAGAEMAFQKEEGGREKSHLRTSSTATVHARAHPLHTQHTHG